MKENLRNEKGITIIALAVIIAVIIIISGAAIYKGVESYREAEKLTFGAELEMIQKKVNETYEKFNMTNGVVLDNLPGQKISELSSETKNKIELLGIGDLSHCRYFNKDTLEDIGVTGIKREIIVDWATRNVFDIKGITIGGIRYHKKGELTGWSNNVEYINKNTEAPEFNLEKIKLEPYKNKIKVKDVEYKGNAKAGNIYYKHKNDNTWKTLTGNEIVNNEVIVLDAGIYQFKIIDSAGNSTEIKEIEITMENAPELVQGMIPIKRNSTNTSWVVTTKYDPEWYEYIPQNGATENGGTSRWANVMLSDGTYKANTVTAGQVVSDSQLGSMFVWIPRYAYKITEGYGITTSTGKIEVKFLKGIGTEFFDKTTESPLTNETEVTHIGGVQQQWFVHPAFKFGSTELEGIWFAKFRASSANGMGGRNGDRVKIVPNVRCWTRGISGEGPLSINIYIDYMFSIVRNMEKNGAYGWAIEMGALNFDGTIAQDSNNFDIHLTKNVEWGAMAYLTHSKYGRNGTRQLYNNHSEYKTGFSGATLTATQGNSENVNTFAYNTEIGKLASTTGNVYGIYDIGSEYIASYVPGGSYSEEYGASVLNANSKYKEILNTGETKNHPMDNYLANSTRLGLALNEIASVNANPANLAWFSQSSTYPYDVSSFFIRGGGIGARGVFGFNNGSGYTQEGVSFRPTIVVEK